MSKDPKASLPAMGLTSVRENGPEHHKLLSPGATETPLNTALEEDDREYIKLGSSWKSSWRTSGTLVALFLFACIVAVAHYAVFKALDGKRTDDPKVISQSYVATLSHLLGLLFRASLCASLAVAFTQHLWRVLRIKTMKVSSIETLFKLTHDPMLLAWSDAVKTVPKLYILAWFSWLLPIAVTFPPGALIVVPNTVQSSSIVTVPVYNGSFLGNTSQADAQWKSLAYRAISAANWRYITVSPNTQRLGRLVLELGDIVPSVSPCGSDCSYSSQFEGPSLQCQESIINQTMPGGGSWDCYLNAFSASNVTTVEPGVGITNFTDNINITVSIPNKNVSAPSGVALQEVKSLSCTPSRSIYKFNVTYKDKARLIQYSRAHVGKISDMIQFSPVAFPEVKNCTQPLRVFCLADWNPVVVQRLTAYNHFALIDSMFNPLAGNYSMMGDYTFQTGSQASFQCGPVGGTIVADTMLNTQRNNHTRSMDDGPIFIASEDILNEALFNLTMSASFHMGFWQERVTALTNNVHQVYSFASQKTLILPYFICILVSVPFLFLGLHSLRANGVSAIEGGFIQVLTTTAGSKALEQQAAKGCLGGNEKIPQSLKDTRIGYGEIVPNGGDHIYTEGDIRRAGFGTEDEIIPLTRGYNYGI